MVPVKMSTATQSSWSCSSSTDFRCDLCTCFTKKVADAVHTKTEDSCPYTRLMMTAVIPSSGTGIASPWVVCTAGAASTPVAPVPGANPPTADTTVLGCKWGEDTLTGTGHPEDRSFLIGL